MLKDIQIRLIKVYNIHERFFLKITITLYAYMTETPKELMIGNTLTNGSASRGGRNVGK
jgi:hypothetical protein